MFAIWRNYLKPSRNPNSNRNRNPSASNSARATNGSVSLLFCILLMTTSSIIAAESKAQTDPLQDFKKRADKFHSVISLPQFEVTTNDVTSTVKKTISDGNAALDIIGALKPAQVTLRNT